MKSKRGGKRKGAGRKPIDDKKIPVTIWVRSSKIQSNGNIDLLKHKLLNFIDDGC